MAKIRSFEFRTALGERRRLELLGGSASSGRHTTVITGRNGSYKSSVLRAIVEAVTQPSGPRGYPLFIDDSRPRSEELLHVVACAGTATDRYPAKEMRGRPTIYDVPHYVYLGQRVGSNIISRKQALETAATHALNPDIRERFGWDFLEHAFEVVGVRPSMELSLRFSRPGKDPKRTQAALLDRVRWAAATIPERRRSDPPPGKPISPALATYLLKAFSEDVFDALRNIESGGRVSRLTLDADLSFASDKHKTDMYRLGLLADELTVIDAQLVSTRNGKSFSAFELSSGEYHLLTAYLGLGFAMRNDSIVLIDEPEVSLHPQWQVDFMRTVEGIASLAMPGNGHIVISTHSPLILSSAPLGSTVIDVDRAGQGTEAQHSPVGAASDALLLDHFGVASGRNFFVVDKVQEAVNLLERGITEAPRLEAIRTDLREIRQALEKSDPFIDLIDAILESGDPAAVR
jgi:predicted ATPase